MLRTKRLESTGSNVVGGPEVPRSPTPTQNSRHNLRSHSSKPPMAKPPHSPLLWRQINQSLSPPRPAFIAKLEPSTPCHRGASSRPFHTTPIRAGPRKTPALRRAAARNIPGGFSLPHTTKNGQRLDRDGFWWAKLKTDVNVCLREFDGIANDLYELTSRKKMMPPGVSFKTFKTVAEQLIRLSHSEHASQGNIKTISTGITLSAREAVSLKRDACQKDTNFRRCRRGIPNRSLSLSS